MAYRCRNCLSFEVYRPRQPIGILPFLLRPFMAFARCNRCLMMFPVRGCLLFGPRLPTFEELEAREQGKTAPLPLSKSETETDTNEFE